MPSYPTVVRFLNAQGLARRGRLDRLRPGEVTALARKQEREVRSFEVAHVHALWHLDFHVSSRLMTTPDGRRLAPRMLCIIDDCSRLVCHAQWYWAESAQCLVHGLTQALLKRGQPRMLLTDNGSAMLADETRRGLDKLSITHETTLPYSPYQNGKQEVFWNQVEGRLLPMLAGPIEHMTLDALNDATQAWVEMEYQHALHREIGTSPAARCLAGPQVSRPCPEMMTLRQAFAMQCSRVVRQSDGTVSVEGKRFEVPSRLRSLRKLVVRYARWDLAHLWAVDPHTDVILAPLHPLDKQANADRHRRRVAVQNADTVAITPTEVAPLMRELIQQYALTGAPPAYLSGPLPSAEEVTP